MSILLDTAPFLWMLAGEEERFSPSLRTQLTDAPKLFLSAVSVWEIAIKAALGKLDITPHIDRWLPDAIQQMGVQSLPILQSHTLAVYALPAIHRDPFDRLLLAQAHIENLVIASPDATLNAYGVDVIW